MRVSKCALGTYFWLPYKFYGNLSSESFHRSVPLVVPEGALLNRSIYYYYVGSIFSRNYLTSLEKVRVGLT
jgi:hypothetical protein